MSTILADRIGSVSLSNGLIRISCITNGGNGEDHATGTLLIPANRMSEVLKSLISATKEMDQRIREQVQQTNAAAKSNVPSSPQAAPTPKQ